MARVPVRAAVISLDPVKSRAVAARIKGSSPVALVEATTTYDTSGRPTSVSAGPRTTRMTYGADGLLASVITPLGTTTFDARDPNGRLLQMTEPGGRKSKFAYDANGNPVAVTPPGGVAHQFGFTASDLLGKYTPPDVGQSPRDSTYTYDKDKLLTNASTPRDALSFTYDGTGRALSGTDGTRRTALSYLPGGRLSNADVESPAGRVSLAYAYQQSLVTGETLAIAGRAYERTYAHDNLFRTTGTTFGGTTLAYGFDLDGVVATVGGLTTNRGATAGLLTRAAVGRTAETFSYTTFGERASTQAEIDGTARGGESLTIEASTGRITGKSETWAFPGVPSAPATTVTYTYDLAGRLSSVTQGGATATYTYDAAGNRAGATVDAQDRVTRQGDVTYTYDVAGFVTRREKGAEPAQVLTWDAAGSLLGISQAPRAQVAYDVDAAERRVGKRRDGVRTRVWAYAGALTVEAEVVNPEDAEPETRLYGYLPDVRLPVLMVSRAGATERTYRLYGDHLGSLRAVVDAATGQAVQTMSHDVWGNVTHDVVSSGFARVPFGFAGGLYDEDTGLVRFGAREYDSSTGRWLSKDSARFGGGWNFYEYVGSDPVSYFDPSGRNRVNRSNPIGELANWAYEKGKSEFAKASAAWGDGEYKSAAGHGGLGGFFTLLGIFIDLSPYIAEYAAGAAVGMAIEEPCPTSSAFGFERTHGLSGNVSSRKVAGLTESMSSKGWQGAPIVVLEHGGAKYILDGHHRVQAAMRAGIDIPYRAAQPNEVPSFGYKSVDDVVAAASWAGPVKLRPVK